ncbi:MAG: enoyl-CoA hydratase/isomerase family protein [Dehalococcoidia bacterium]
MADFEYSVDGRIGVMRFNRPEKLNAITYEMLDRIDDAVRSAATDDRVRAVVLTGTGRAFSAGTDLQELSARPGNEAGGRSGRPSGSDLPAPWTMSSLKKPTVCAVNGAAVGLGVELTSQCDVRIAGESARFGWVFVHRGLVPDTGAGTWLLSRIVGLQTAAFLLYSGEIISAEKALELGYVMEVVPDTSLMERSLEVAAHLSRGGPLATGEVKRLLYHGAMRTASAHVEDNAATLGRMFQSEDFKEGVSAFLQRREPDWKGR